MRLHRIQRKTEITLGRPDLPEEWGQEGGAPGLGRGLGWGMGAWSKMKNRASW